MFSWLKNHFIPHEGNDHRPHLLRDSYIRYILGFIIFLEIFTLILPTITRVNLTGGLAAVISAVLDELTNEQRKAQNLPTLSINSTLNEAAQLKANDMATLGYFAHTSPEGKTPWYWIQKVGYKYQYAGENLAINFTDSKDVTNAWMNSPTHKANIVKDKYTEIGTGVATGMYQGREAIFVAQVYASPFPEPTPIPVAKETPVKPAEPSPVVAVAREPEPQNILGAEALTNTTKEVKIANTALQSDTMVKEATFWQKIIASPRNTTNVILYIIFSIISLAMLLYIIIKIRNHHLDLLTNGLVVVAIVGAFFVTNYYYSQNNMVIASSLDYGRQY